MPNGAAKKNDHATGNGEYRFEYRSVKIVGKNDFAGGGVAKTASVSLSLIHI